MRPPLVIALALALVVVLPAVMAAKAGLDDTQLAAGTITAAPRNGDVDCDDKVSAVDALKVLRYVAGLLVTQTEPCEDIGSGGPPVQGNVDCSTVGNAVSAVDALKILRFVAGLPVSQQQGCRSPGT